METRDHLCKACRVSAPPIRTARAAMGHDTRRDGSETPTLRTWAVMESSAKSGNTRLLSPCRRTRWAREHRGQRGFEAARWLVVRWCQAGRARSLSVSLAKRSRQTPAATQTIVSCKATQREAQPKQGGRQKGQKPQREKVVHPFRSSKVGVGRGVLREQAAPGGRERAAWGAAGGASERRSQRRASRARVSSRFAQPVSQIQPINAPQTLPKTGPAPLQAAAPHHEPPSKSRISTPQPRPKKKSPSRRPRRDGNPLQHPHPLCAKPGFNPQTSHIPLSTPKHISPTLI